MVVDLEAFDGSKTSVCYDEFSITGDTYDLTVDVFNLILGVAGTELDKKIRKSLQIIFLKFNTKRSSPALTSIHSSEAG